MKTLEIVRNRHGNSTLFLVSPDGMKKYLVSGEHEEIEGLEAVLEREFAAVREEATKAERERKNTCWCGREIFMPESCSVCNNDE